MESLLRKEASGVPTPDAVVTVDDHRFGFVQFPQAGREFREWNEARAGQVCQFEFPWFAHIKQLSASVREVFADSVRRQLLDVHRGMGA